MDSRLTDVSLRRLQVFLVVCDTLHMAQAAERLGVAQPALSQQIHALERALGVELFHRRKRGIDLTAAGEACRTEAERLLSLHAGAIETVRRIGRGEMGRLTLGYVASAMFEPRFPAQLKRMRNAFPDVELDLREGSISALLAGVEAGDIDVALVRAPIVASTLLRHQLHSGQDLVVILQPGHPLAKLPKIPIARLAPEPMIGFPDSEKVGIMRVAQQLAAAEGAQLHVRWRVAEIGSILGLVAAGLGFGIVPKNIALLAGAEIVSRPLATSGARAELWLVWREDRETPALLQFLKIATPQDKPERVRT
ncbi:LysR family transcriptional regulator [Azorhizobium doebereinerae]|uniref:LysR family transcriptional regulator n=1 Tax=Azorhizobium doebereinerae TaxID=281091 RepID=UPI0004147627|nr:LysR substrate-binding domain-containing protein [Azorhizobium doebereinerae]